MDSSLISRTGEVVFYHSAILNGKFFAKNSLSWFQFSAISSSTAVLPIIADQYSHVTLNLFFEYVYLGIISKDVSIRTYRELWNLGRQLKLKNLQNVLHPFTGVGEVLSPSRKRSKHPTLRKEKVYFLLFIGCKILLWGGTREEKAASHSQSNQQKIQLSTFQFWGLVHDTWSFWSKISDTKISA